jgi:hypothetical protein
MSLHLRSRKQASLFILSVVLLTACSKEPSPNEVKNAVTLYIKENYRNVLQNKILGLSLDSMLGIKDVEVNSVEKINCKSTDQNIAICDVVVDFTLISSHDGIFEAFGGIGRQKKITKYQFVKTSKGWIVAKDGVF